jgi:predicted component of type VI protein secretion system
MPALCPPSRILTQRASSGQEGAVPSCTLVQVAATNSAFDHFRLARRPAARRGGAIPRSGCARGVACAPSPTPPRPSRVGMPSPAVKLPSEPPPTAASPSFHPNSRAMSAGLRVQRGYSGGALHGRTIDSSADFDFAFAIEGTKAAHLLIDSGRIFHARDAYVDLRGRFGRNHVGARSAADDSDVDRQALLSNR